MRSTLGNYRDLWSRSESELWVPLLIYMNPEEIPSPTCSVLTSQGRVCRPDESLNTVKSEDDLWSLVLLIRSRNPSRLEKELSSLQITYPLGLVMDQQHTGYSIRSILQPISAYSLIQTPVIGEHLRRRYGSIQSHCWGGVERCPNSGRYRAGISKHLAWVQQGFPASFLVLLHNEEELEHRKMLRNEEQK